MKPTKYSERLRALLVAVAMLFGLGAASAVMATPAHADAAHQAVIGMPFAGKWAYNVNVNPPYTDANSSHPSVHAAPGGGDWATDLYASVGTDVKLNIPYATGSLTYSWASSSTSCGQSTRLNIFVDGVNVGWLYFAHLNNAVTSGAISNGMTLGTVKDWGGCNPGPHVHVEFHNATNFSCYVDNGHPGVALTAGSNLGVLGSDNAAARQACSSVPSATVGSASKPAAVTYTTGAYSELNVFTRGGSHIYKDTWNGSSWSGFSDMGGVNFVGDPYAVQFQSELDVFALSSDGHVYKDTWNGTSWTGWSSLGGNMAGNPKAIQFNSSYGELDVFARGTDGALYKDTWNGSSWSGFNSLGGSGLAADPSVVQWAGEMDVYIRNVYGTVYKDTWNGSSWSGFNSLGGNVASSPAAVVHGSEMDVFAGSGSDGYMFKNTWNGSSWSGFSSMGGGLGTAVTPAPISYNGELDVYVRGGSGQIYKDTWNGSSWSGYNSLNGPTMSSDASTVQYGSEMDVFATGSDGHVYKDTWNGSSWSGFSSLL